MSSPPSLSVSVMSSSTVSSSEMDTELLEELVEILCESSVVSPASVMSSLGWVNFVWLWTVSWGWTFRCWNVLRVLSHLSWEEAWMGSSLEVWMAVLSHHSLFSSVSLNSFDAARYNANH